MTDLLTTEDVAKWLNVSTKFVQRLTRDGKLHANNGLYEHSDVEAFLDSVST